MGEVSVMQPANWHEIAMLRDDEAMHQIRIQGTTGAHALNWSCTCQRLAGVCGPVGPTYEPLGLVDAPIETILARHRKHVLGEGDHAAGHGGHARRVPRRLGLLRGRRRAGTPRDGVHGPSDGVRADRGVRAVGDRPGPAVPGVATERSKH